MHVPRSGNTHVDSLATLATSSAQSLPRVILIEDLCKPTKVKGQAVHVHQIRARPTWMDPIVLYLREDILPEDKSEADKIRRKATRFWLSKDQKLYKRFFLSHIYSVCTLKRQSYSLRRYMKEFMEATQEASLCLTELSLKATGGQICRK